MGFVFSCFHVSFLLNETRRQLKQLSNSSLHLKQITNKSSIDNNFIYIKYYFAESLLKNMFLRIVAFVIFVNSVFIEVSICFKYIVVLLSQIIVVILNGPCHAKIKRSIYVGILLKNGAN